MRVVQTVNATHPIRRRRPNTTPSLPAERRHAGLRVLVLRAVHDAGAPVSADRLRSALDARNIIALAEVLDDLANEGLLNVRKTNDGEARYDLAFAG